MSTGNHTISLVIPCYNSGERFHELIESLNQLIVEITAIKEIILVDDDSEPVYKTLLQQTIHYLPPVYKLIENNKNLGQEKATMEGIKQASGDLIVTLDDDMEYPPKFIHKLLKIFKESGADLVYGIPRKNKHIFYRDIPREMFYKINWLLGYSIFSPFRLFKAELKTALLENAHKQIFCFDKILMRQSKKTERVLVDNCPSLKSRYSAVKLIRKVLYFYLYR